MPKTSFAVAPPNFAPPQGAASFAALRHVLAETPTGITGERTGTRNRRPLLSALTLIGTLVAGPAFSQSATTFTVESVSADSYTAILKNPQGHRLKVTGTPRNTDCFSISSDGVVSLFARSSVPDCNQTIVMEFSSETVDISTILFDNIDDMDGSGPRDAFAATVPGTWSSPFAGKRQTTSGGPYDADAGTLSVYSLAGNDFTRGTGHPAETYDAGRANFLAAGAVGSFLVRDNYNNPIDDSGRFVLDTPVTSFNILMEDAEGTHYLSDDPDGTRSARLNFDLSVLPAEVYYFPEVDDEIGVTGKVTGDRVTVIDVLDGDTDTDGNIVVSSLRITGTDAAGDSLTVAGQGVWSIETGKIAFTPEAGFFGDPDPITYTVKDNTGRESAAATVSIDYAYVVAADDDATGTPINGHEGGATGSLLTNDTLNDVAVDPTAVSATVTDADGLSGLAVNAKGALELPAGTPAGSYDIGYELCEDAVPGNCDTARVTVEVSAAPIVAADDAPGVIDGRDGGSTLSVLDNDTLNGRAVDLSKITLTPGTAPAPARGAISMAADGRIEIAAGTTADTYSYAYEICEDLNPGNCAAAQASISVSAAALVATNDLRGPHVGRRTGAIDGAALFANDTIGGDPADLSEISVTAGSIDGIGLASDGTISLDGPKPVGRYTRSYEICEILNPANCTTGDLTLEVSAAAIAAAADEAGTLPGRSGGTAADSVFANDLLDGAAPAAEEVSLRVETPDTAGRLTLDADGRPVLAAGTPAGTYSLGYEICETLNPGNCATATASLEALAAVLAPEADAFGRVNRPAGYADIGNIFANDLIDSAALSADDIDLTVDLPAGSPLSIAQYGTVSVASETPNGRYEGSYRICETLNPGNCAGPIAFAVSLTERSLRTIELPENGTEVDGYTPDAAESWTLWDADAAQFILAADGSLSFRTAPDFEAPADANADNFYEVTVTAKDAAGAETDQGLLIRITDLDEIAPALTGPAAPSVAENQTAVAVYTADEDVTWSLSGPDAALFEVAADGALSFRAAPDFEAADGADADRLHEITLTATDARGNAAHLDVAVTVTDVVEIAATDDVPGSPVPGRAGAQAAIDVLANDTLNGARPTAAEVALRLLPGADLADGRIALSPEGPVSVAAGTPAGRYELGYEICAQNAPESCAQAGAVIDVAAATLALSPDAFGTTPVDGRDGGVAGNVLANDTIDGAAFEADEVEMSLVAASVPGLLIDPDGALRVGAGTVAGTHDATYRVCEILNPGNCAESTVGIGVDASEIEVADDDLTDKPIYGVAGGVTDPVIANDLLGGAPVVAEEVVMSITDDGGLDGVGLDAAGRITVPGFTEPGLYDVGYGVCEALNPENCIEGVARVSVVPIAAVAGTIFDDVDRDGQFDPGRDRGVGAGYRVVVIDAEGVTQPIFDAEGQPVEFVTTDAEGDYELYVDAGAGYRVVMYSPAGEALGGFGIGDLEPGQRLENQNLPIDPSGVIYDSVTRDPIEGVRVTLTDAGGRALPARCLADPAQQNQVTGADGFYRFDVAPAAAPECPTTETEYRIAMDLPGGFEAGASTRLPVASEAAFDATTCIDDPIPGGNCEISASANPPAAGETARYFLSFLLEAGDPNVINNHIAVDATLADPLLDFTALTEEATRGTALPFRIVAREVEYGRIDVEDMLPQGFVYAEGSARVNGRAQEPEIDGRRLRFAGLSPDAKDEIEITLSIVAAGEIGDGRHVSTALLRDPDDGTVLARAEAAVSLVPERVFDCGDVVGRVYEDRDGNGHADADEPGLGGMVLRAPGGETVLTDAHGRFSVPCAMLPRAGIGSNMQLKLDERALPEGWIPSTPNPQVTRLTRGKMARMDFGVQPGRKAVLQLTDAAFGADGQLLPEWQDGMRELIAALAEGPTRLGLVYLDPSRTDIARARLDALSDAISRHHASGASHQPLVLETLIRGDAR